MAIAVWWLFLSRAPWPDRIGAIVLASVAIVVTRFVVHESIAGGHMRMMLWIYSIPALGCCGSRTIGVAPSDGTLLWDHVWQPGAGIVQPALAADDDVLITTGDAMGGLGIRRVPVAHGTDGWNVEERWTTRGLKPYFNDFVVHKGHAYGFRRQHTGRD